MTVGVYAVLFIQLMRWIASKLVDIDATQPLGKAIGGLVHFA